MKPLNAGCAIPSSTSDLIYFLDEETSHKLSSVNTSKTGTPGAMAVIGNGNTLLVSSTGGMTKFEIGMTPPGTVINPPTSLKQYRDFAFDIVRGVIYGTDASGRVDVIDQNTSMITKSYLLPNGADPIGIDLSPNGNELAVALNGLQCILFLNSETGSTIARVKPLNSDDSNLPYDVIYGRSGRLYSDGNPGQYGFDYLHVIDTTTHTWLAKSSFMIRTGAELAITSDKKYLYANDTFSPNNIYVFDVQTDTLSKLYEGPHGYVTANRFTIIPNGSKVFTSSGQVWSGNMQTRLGTLFANPGIFIKYIANKNMVALTHGNAIEFVDGTNYKSIWTHFPGYSGDILEMEVAPDGTKLIADYPGGIIYILNLTNFPPTPLPSSTLGPGPTRTPGPSSTPGPSPTPVPSSFTGNRRTYTASSGSLIPGSFLCDQTQPVCTSGANIDADNAHRYAADTFVFYNTHHGRNSFDNRGSTIISTVHYGINYYNAFWNGYQMVYGDYMVADDIVGHELTHGVTQYTSNLIYAYQSGAINESFSDIWGEFIDQTNGSGNDSDSVKWLIGEDSFLRANRSMKDPTAYGAPDKMSSLLYSNDPYDNGGVHINSGVNNKAAYLMVEGGEFNNRIIIGIGLNKTAAVYYETQVYHLTMGANYNDLYYALIQACQNLIGGGDGITQNDCGQVRMAAEAVEMIPEPAAPTATLTPPATPTFTPTATVTMTVPTNQAGIEVWVGGEQQSNAPVGSGEALRVSYAGINNGPVKIMSRNAISLIGAERVIYNVNGLPTSFSEMMGLPDGQLDNTYWMPWYNNVDLDTQLRFGNVSNTPGEVHLWIGGQEKTSGCTSTPANVPYPYVLAVGASLRVSCPGVNNGPVKIISDVNIVAAERVIYNVNGLPTSFTEMKGLPDGQLDNTYWMPWYNNVDLDTQLRFGNVSNTPATVRVWIGTQEMTTGCNPSNVPYPYVLVAGASLRVSCPSVNNGPVKIVSDVNIVAAERVIYNVNGLPTSFSEMMALPNHQLDSIYWMPWYNNVDLDTQLRFGNVSNTPATVRLYIGGQEIISGCTPSNIPYPYVLDPGASLRISCPAINNGPIKIVSDQNIVAAERVIYNVNNLPTSFSEMMALPGSQLNSTYWLPWYNNIDLDTQLRFGVP